MFFTLVLFIHLFRMRFRLPFASCVSLKFFFRGDKWVRNLLSRIIVAFIETVRELIVEGENLFELYQQLDCLKFKAISIPKQTAAEKGSRAYLDLSRIFRGISALFSALFSDM